MTVENISWSISTKECCRPRRGLNPRPSGLQSDCASNWATEAGNNINFAEPHNTLVFLHEKKKKKKKKIFETPCKAQDKRGSLISIFFLFISPWKYIYCDYLWSNSIAGYPEKQSCKLYLCRLVLRVAWKISFMLIVRFLNSCILQQHISVYCWVFAYIKLGYWFIQNCCIAMRN